MFSGVRHQKVSTGYRETGQACGLPFGDFEGFLIIERNI